MKLVESLVLLSDLCTNILPLRLCMGEVEMMRHSGNVSGRTAKKVKGYIEHRQENLLFGPHNFTRHSSRERLSRIKVDTILASQRVYSPKEVGKGNFRFIES